MTNQERNEARLMTVIELLRQIVEQKTQDHDDEDRPFARSEMEDQIQSLQRVMGYLDMVAKTFDLPYIVDDQPSWYRAA